MTYEKAIEMLKDRKFGAAIRGHEETAEMCEMAIDALEKQMPKKPIERFAFSDDIEAGLCPSCNEGVNEEMDFCSYCGQAIDWGVGE